MKKFKLILPQNIEDYRLEHLPAFNTLYDYDHSLESQIEIVSNVTKVAKRFIRELKESDVNRIYMHILLTFKDFVLPDHKKEITVNGKEYVMTDPNKVGAGWWMDYRSLPDNAKPSLICAMMYVEKGFKYAQEDENENVINPTMDRAKEFEIYFPMVDYMASRVFFLKKLNQSQINSIQSVLIAKRIVKMLRRSPRILRRSKQ